MVKFSNYQALEKQLSALKRQTVPRVIAVAAKDPFLLKETLQLIEKSLQMALVMPELTFKKVTAETLDEELSSFSLFSPFSLLYLAGADELEENEHKALERALSTHGPQTLILSAKSFPSKLEKKIDAEGILFEVLEPKPWEKQQKAEEWIQAHLVKYKMTIQREAKQLLAKEFQEDRALLFQELEKVITYCSPKKEITLDDVKSISAFSDKALIWSFGDALFERNKPLVMQLLHSLLDDDTHSLQLVRYLRNQLRVLLEIAALQDEKKSYEEMTATFPKMTPKTFEKNFTFAKKLGTECLASAIIKLDTLEVDLKNTNSDEKLLFELYLLSF